MGPIDGAAMTGAGTIESAQGRLMVDTSRWYENLVRRGAQYHSVEAKLTRVAPYFVSYSLTHVVEKVTAHWVRREDTAQQRLSLCVDTACRKYSWNRQYGWLSNEVVKPPCHKCFVGHRPQRGADGSCIRCKVVGVL